MTQQRISTKDHVNLPIERWNVATFLAYLTDETQRQFGVTYAPGGRGALSSRWSMERGMLNAKKAQYGNATLRKFIELALESYSPTADYPYVTFTFMISYRDRLFITAQKAVSDEARAKKLADEAKVNELSDDEFEELL
jgi:hypothetical protein